MIGLEIGPYKILEMLGQGGMGVVYRGMHTKLEQMVAIKVLSPAYSQDVSMRARFVHEAKLQAKLSHPNVVNILNYLEDDKNIYLVMEFVEGETLELRLLNTGALDMVECYHITLSVLDALDFMHEKGIIHRDIKPSNIMLTNMDQVKVTDFGIAKALGEEGQTRTGVHVGTVWYMSPEQIKGKNLNVTSDIYALGITLYQMTTGVVPFRSESEFEVMKAHVEQTPKPPVSLNPDIPQKMNDIILKALAKDEKERFQSAKELKKAIYELAYGVPLEGWQNIGRVLNRVGSEGKEAPQSERESEVSKEVGNKDLILGYLGKKKFYVLAGAAFLVLILLIYLIMSGAFTGEKRVKEVLPLTRGSQSKPDVKAFNSLDMSEMRETPPLVTSVPISPLEKNKGETFSSVPEQIPLKYLPKPNEIVIEEPTAESQPHKGSIVSQRKSKEKSSSMIDRHSTKVAKKRRSTDSRQIQREMAKERKKSVRGGKKGWVIIK